MSFDNPKQLVHRYVEDVWNGRMPAMPFFASHYQRYLSPTLAPLTGKEQQHRIAGFLIAFPDLRFTLEDLFADGDRVVFRATMRGTHLGEFGTVAPTGNRISGGVLDIVRVQQGLFAEHWGGPDLFDLFGQLGVCVPGGTDGLMTG